MFGPLFSTALDSDPVVRVWVDSLSDAERRALRDDVTPRFKEVPTATVEGPPAPAPDEERLGPDEAADLRATMAEVASAVLPRWQARAFRRWVNGASPSQIARDLGRSRASVRAALRGQQHRGRPGAIEALVAALSHDEEFLRMAKKKIEESGAAPKTDRWFRGIARRPELFAAWSLLLVLDDLADARREVPIADLWAVVPRAVITPLLAQLKAHGMAVSDGRKVKIARTPIEMEADR